MVCMCVCVCRCQVSICCSHTFHSERLIQDFQVIYSWLSLLYSLLHGSLMEKVIFSIMQPFPGEFIVLLICLFMYFWGTRSCCVAKIVLELMMYLRLALNLLLLLLPPACQDYIGLGHFCGTVVFSSCNTGKGHTGQRLSHLATQLHPCSTRDILMYLHQDT